MVSLAVLLFRKLYRDVFKLLGPALTLSLVMAAGLSSLIMSQSNLRSLQISQRETYQKLRFADALIPLIRIPRTALQALNKIDGIRSAECRLSESGQVRLAKQEKQIAARFHSLPEEGSLNRVKLTEGRWPSADSPNEAILSDAFALAWKIHSGDIVEVLIKGKIIRFKVSGLARSPEYVYQTGSATSIPDDKLFSAWWVHRRIIEQTSDLQSSCNEILISAQSERQLKLAEPEIAERLRPFGFTHIVFRKNQLSHYFLESELTQLKAMSIYMPSVFLAVTLFLLNITMTRVLMTQRESIGTLRAFGFGRKIIAIQAVALAFACLLPGLLVGVTFGLWLSKQMFSIYVLFYRFAYVTYEADQRSLFSCALLCIATALSGSWWGLRNILREPPALALVPAAPRHTRATALDSLPLINRLSLTLRMSVRNIFRRPLQSGVTCIGLILATALLVFARFEEYAIEQLLDIEYRSTQRQSHTLLFYQRLPMSAAESVLAQLRSGVSEVSLTLPVTLKYQSAARDLTLIVKSDDEQLRHIENIKNSSLSRLGISLSQSLADVLHIRPPCLVSLTTKDRIPTERSVEVTDLSDNLMGTIATISQRNFMTLFGSEKSFNTVLHKTSLLTGLDEKLLFDRNPLLVSLSEKNFEKMAFEKTMAENIGIFRNFMIGFALLIAMGVLYNNARIQFAEREREFSLLRALGFFEAELTLIFWTDFLLLTSVAIAPGLWLGRKILEWIMRALETEVFRIPVIITPQSYLWASAVLLLGVFLTALIIQPQIHRIAFLSVLKARE